MNATSEQATRIAESFKAASYDVDLIHDSENRPLVVVLRRSFNPDDYSEVVRLASANWQRAWPTPDLETAIPTGGISGATYPEEVCDIVDLAVRGALGRSDVSAARLCAAEITTTADGGDTPPHTDFPANLDNPPPDQVHGLNVHFTLAGKANARFCRMARFDDVRALAESLLRAKAAGHSDMAINSALAEAFGRRMSCATEAVRLEAGDVTIFQARPHLDRGLLPTIHHFVTASRTRWHAVFMPGASERMQVEAARQRSSEDGETKSPS